MLNIVEVPQGGVQDDAEAGLIVPVPAPAANTIVFEQRDGEDIKRLNASRIRFTINDKRVLEAADVKVAIFVTEARLAVACSKYDKGGGWVGSPVGMLVLNAGSKALAAYRRHGKMLVGQVRYPWLSRVGSTSRMGWGSNETIVLYTQADANTRCRLDLVLPKNVDAASVAADVARRAARYRLAADHKLVDEERLQLARLSTAERIVPSKKHQIDYHVFPTHWFVNNCSARLAPCRPAAPARELDAVAV